MPRLLFRNPRFVAAALAAALGAIHALAQEPLPEEAFAAPAAESAPPAVESAPPAAASTPVPSPDFTAPQSEFTPAELALADSLNPPDKPAPLFQKWLDSLFDLVASDEPYRRDRFKLILGTSIGYDNNVLYSATDRIGSPTWGVNGAMDYTFGTKRLQIEAKLGASVNYYEKRPGGSNDQNYSLTLGIDYQWKPRLSLSFDTFTQYLSQPSPQLVGGIFQYTGNYLYTDTHVSAVYQMRPRWSLQFGYDFSGFKYEDESFNQSSGFYQQLYSLSANYLLTPRTTLVLEYRYNPVTYYEAGLGSTGHFLLGGIRQTLSPRLDYTLMLGAEFRQLENPSPDSPPSYLGPFAQGSLTYKFAPRSMIIGNMRLGTEPAGVSGVTIRETFRADLSLSQKIGSRLSLEGFVSVEFDKYDQPGAGVDYSQSIYGAGIALRYQFATATSAVLRDDYLMVESTLPDSTYDHNFVSIGLEVAF